MFWRMDPTNLKPGQRVDGWRIVRKLGGGSYGVVYEVEKDGKRFALKVACQADNRGDPKQTDARARREAVCLGKLGHPHIIRMWAQGRWREPRSGFLYVVLDFVDGYTLGEWVRRTYPTVHEVVVLFRKLFDALEHMHARGVFHRDLSLRNIMVTQQGEPVIIDFGAADYAAAEELTDAPLPPCTPRNRSPEAMEFWRENRLNPQARYPFQATDDIFALGADLYDVLTDPTADFPKNRPSLHGVVPPPSPFKVTQGRVPSELSSYAMMLIHQSLEVRPATAKDARRPLEDFERYEGPEWRDTRPHPVVAQLPPEPVEGAPVPVEEEPPGSEEAPIPAHPSAVQGAWRSALHSARLKWGHVALGGLLVLGGSRPPWRPRCCTGPCNRRCPRWPAAPQRSLPLPPQCWPKSRQAALLSYPRRSLPRRRRALPCHCPRIPPPSPAASPPHRRPPPAARSRRFSAARCSCSPSHGLKRDARACSRARTRRSAPRKPWTRWRRSWTGACRRPHGGARNPRSSWM
ncbi:serine/threonine-protein kinase [Hyalangium gracile]|uniref:serine/threonine-protein kinase n=1 Tax=Hyalangium gracile TaxID=394092 RepID=UPI001CCF7777|nr:serine/threonine-protein kinase [Hyalangium gracile]